MIVPPEVRIIRGGVVSAALCDVREGIRLSVMPRIMAFLFFSLFQIAYPNWAPLPFVLRPITPEGFSYKETLLAADIDHDGDSDFFGGDGRPGRSWWFEHKSDG